MRAERRRGGIEHSTTDKTEAAEDAKSILVSPSSSSMPYEEEKSSFEGPKARTMGDVKDETEEVVDATSCGI